MADQSDIAKALFEALPAADNLDDSTQLPVPVLDNWSLMVSLNEREVAVVGIVSGSSKFPHAHTIGTSALRAVGAHRRFVVTQNSIYRLGWPARASLDADADHLWPPALAMATATDWVAAAAEALHYTGEFTLMPGAVAAVMSAFRVGTTWTERRAACMAIAEELFHTGRNAVAEAWSLLGTYLPLERDRQLASTYVCAAALQANDQYARVLTADEALADNGWRLLSAMDDAQIGKLRREGVPINDPIVAARKIALRAERTGKTPDVEPGDDPEASGVVVLREVGGTSLSSSGKEAVAEFAKIAGIPLPLAPVGDLAASRRALAAEFPHAAEQIDVILSDLVGAEFVRLRPTLFVGEPGGGKSRLVRRLAETLGVGLQRFDGAASSDNAFGGTPRRWSSGEHCVPLEAIRRHQIANPIVFVDEIDKAGRSRHNGALTEALIPFMEVETSRSYPDPYVQADVDLSCVSYMLTANRDEDLPAPLKDRLRIIRLPKPTIEHLPALARGIVSDIAQERGGDPRWWPALDDGELAIAEELWIGGSIRRLRTIVERILAYREERPRN